MPITREQFEAAGSEVMEFLRTHADQAWAIWEIAPETKIPPGDVASALANAGSLLRRKVMGGCQYFLYARPECAKPKGPMAERPQFWVRLEPDATVKHFLVGESRAEFRTACGILATAYLPHVEGKAACPKCLEYTRCKVEW
ncbi:MAG: hypothetical protein Q8O40_08315 [Chloroflexota bacterium]|nr:hypothetical protein [Chloroflexota bacterium]